MKKIGFGIVAFLILICLSCKNNSKELQQHEVNGDNSILIEKGKEIASSTFLSLSSELKKAMQEGGVVNAVSYCNIKAMPITDSLSELFNTDIRRTSLNCRNPNNKPTAEEEKIINQYVSLKAEEKPMLPMVVDEVDYKAFYAPIIIQDMCLKCHGKKEDIEAYDMIANLYPEDMAHGYKQGDLRGIWSIHFRNNTGLSE